MDTDQIYQENLSPEVGANFCSKLFFCWTLPLFKYGYKNNLQMKDVFSATKEDRSEGLGDELEKKWKAELAASKQSNRSPSLQRAILKTFYKSYAALGIFVLMFISIRLSPAIFLAKYIQHFEVPLKDRDYINGWIWASSIVIAVFLGITLEHFITIRCQKIGMRIRIACCSLIYRKLLRLNHASLGSVTTGKLVNLLSNDVQRFDLASTYFHYIWILPIQFIVAFYIMYKTVGIASIAGMLMVIIQTLPIQGYFSKVLGKFRYKIALRTDNRVKLMSELTSGIQVIKMYAWELPFQTVVAKAREVEIDAIKKASYVRGTLDGTLVYSERVYLYLTMITHLLLGNRLMSDVVFSLAQLFNQVQFFSTGMFRIALQFFSEAKVSVKRIEEFLLLEEQEKDYGIENEAADIDIVKQSRVGTVTVTKVDAEWSPDISTLTNINLRIAPGTLCAIVGNVGCGKSSLLHVLLGELSLKHGDINVSGKVSYASQTPWLFTSSVRNNILFGRPFIESRYNDVIIVCALEKDFQQFPYGDKTLVGERGVSLSGGQKARINLARAIYADADIYLLDDPLSAVDTRVGKHLFQECLKNFLRNKTRILVTHQMQFLREADQIVVMSEGKIMQTGSFDELAKANLPDVLTKLEIAKESNAITRTESSKHISQLPSELAESCNPQVIEEAKEEGSIPFSTYLEYWRAGTSIAALILLIFLLIVSQVATNSVDLWLRYWTNEEFLVSANTTEEEFVSSQMYLEHRNYNIIIYTTCLLFSIILITVRSLTYFKICMDNSTAIHRTMFSCVLQTPMRFFDTNPSGRILNRFSKDMGFIDEILPTTTYHVFQISLVLVGIMVMVFVCSPYMVIPAIFLGIGFYYIRLVYLATAQDVKRLEGIARAPVFSHTTASLLGISTIRASKAEEVLTKEFDNLQDQHTGTWYMFITSSEALGMYLDIASSIFVAIATFQFMFYPEDVTLSGNVGLVISQCLTLTGMLQFGVRQTAEVVSLMINVERVLQYTRLEKEETKNVLPEAKLKKTWPSAGKVTLSNMYLRYAPEDPPVLKNLNVEIIPQEKVGIVGRTGAGKSSLIAAVFRLAPIEGVVAIDDVDTSTIDLTTLRSNISIIPQEPVLFSGTIRYNLDPFETVQDAELWKAIEHVELNHVILDLNQMVQEGGVNFSVGQRQLICLARAIVRNNKILVLDEATANVDNVTDALIQKSIRDNFQYCTVLTIAHRLNTIMDSDKVIVMEAGSVVEFDHPHILLQNPAGYFTKMVRETGTEMEAILRNEASKAFENKLKT